MSHFTVLVVGENVRNQLQPFHEFECTGESDQYVVEVDETEEAREAYQKETAAYLRSPEGNLIDAYADQFYRDPTDDEVARIGRGTGAGMGIQWTSKDWGDGEGYRTRVRFIPEGYEEVEMSVAGNTSFREFVKDYYGYEVVYVHPDGSPALFDPEDGRIPPGGGQIDLEDKHKYGRIEVTVYPDLNIPAGRGGEAVRVIRRTNPNKKWDWWQVGGRWTGFFHLKPGAAGILGEPGLMTERPTNSARADSALKGDIDFDSMRAKHDADARDLYRKAHEVIAGRTIRTWERIRSTVVPIDAAREEYNTQPVIRDLCTSEDEDLRWADADVVEQWCSLTEDEYATRYANRAISTFAVLKDGVWHERGKMGWWAIVTDEVMTDQEWDDHYARMIAEIPDNVLLTVVDCHT